jgi:hypothetical protein
MHRVHVPGERITTGEGLLRAQVTSHLVLACGFRMHCTHVPGEHIITGEGLLRAQVTSHLVLAWVMEGVLVLG